MANQKTDQPTTSSESTTFIECLQSNISKANYEQLPALLGISKRKFTRLEQHPRAWTAKEMEQLRPLLFEGNITLNHMIDTFCMGYDGLKAAEYLNFKSDQLPF